MKETLHAVRLYSPQARRAQKARRRQQDVELVAAGKGAPLQARNRLIPNAKEWRLEAPEEAGH
jgi:hypothetical protein